MSSISKAEIVKAAAGSGKTFKLAKAFIKLLILNPNDYHQILALTFTNDAKNEMKTRILKELSALSNDEHSVMLTEIEIDFERENVPLNQQQIVHRSNLALTNVLNDYSRFNVVTLDRFFTQLIRHLARELKLNLGYELDIDASKALDEAIQGLYSSKDEHVKKWLRAFINFKIEEDKGWNIEFNIKNLGYKLFQDSFIDIQHILRDNAENLEDFVKQLQKQVKNYQTAMQAAGAKAMAYINSCGLIETDFKAHTVNVFKKLSEEKLKLNEPFSATFIKGEWANKTAERKQDIEDCATGGLNDIHAKIVELYTSEKKMRYVEAKNLLLNIYSYGVLSALADNLWKYRSENNVLLISDTASILHGVVSLSDAPFMYEKIGTRFKHIMIDEFQDTSSHQWKNILPLLQYALFEEGHVLLVGDVKQSIYRWRGGDATLLIHRAAADLSDHSPVEHAMDTNYRSGKNIIAFNNAFFKMASATLSEVIEGFESKQEDVVEAYSGVEQKVNKKFDGYVKAEFFTDNEEHKIALGWQEQAFMATTKTITQVLNDGFYPEDILILVRKNKEASEVATYLLNHGIHAITDEALQLEKSPLVQFIINALQLIITPNSKLALTNVGFFQQIINQTPASQSLGNLLEQSPFSDFSSNLTAYEAIEKLVEEYSLNKQFDPFLQGLQDLSLTLSQSGYASISSFIARWNELHLDSKSKPSIILGKPKGAVRVKSIHKSKGLESPVVIIPQINGSFYNPNHVFWPTELPNFYNKWGSLPLKLTKKLSETSFDTNYTKECYDIALEELNTLYVAFTRAVERMYIFANGNKNRQGEMAKNSFQKVINHVFQNPEFGYSSFFNENVFELGATEKAQNRKDDGANDLLLHAYPVSNPTLKLVPTLSVNFWKQRDTTKANNLREGIITHAIMAQLTVFDVPDLANLLDKILMLMVLNGKMTNPETAFYKSKIVEIFDKIPELHQWFAPGWQVINEHKILENGKTHIPDRVVIKENTAILIDFKKEAKSDSHKMQIKSYAVLLAKMGYQVQGMYLVYTELFEMEEVT